MADMALCEESQPHLLARVLRNQTRKMKTLSFFVVFFLYFRTKNEWSQIYTKPRIFVIVLMKMCKVYTLCKVDTYVCNEGDCYTPLI